MNYELENLRINFSRCVNWDVADLRIVCTLMKNWKDWKNLLCACIVQYSSDVDHLQQETVTARM